MLAVVDVCESFSAMTDNSRKHSLDTNNQVITDDAGASSGTFQLSAVNPRRYTWAVRETMMRDAF